MYAKNKDMPFYIGSMELITAICGGKSWKSDKLFDFQGRNGVQYMQEPNFKNMEQGQTVWILCVVPRFYLLYMHADAALFLCTYR